MKTFYLLLGISRRRANISFVYYVYIGVKVNHIGAISMVLA